MHPYVFKISFNDSVLYVGSAVRSLNQTNATMKFKSTRANLPFYSFVRGLGGWVHVGFVVCEEYPGIGKTELRLREKEWAERLSPMYSKKKRNISSVEYQRMYRASKPPGYYAERIQHWRDQNPLASKAIRARENARRRARRAQAQEMGVVSANNK